MPLGNSWAFNHSSIRKTHWGESGHSPRHQPPLPPDSRGPSPSAQVLQEAQVQAGKVPSPFPTGRGGPAGSDKVSQPSWNLNAPFSQVRHVRSALKRWGRAGKSHQQEWNHSHSGPRHPLFLIQQGPLGWPSVLVLSQPAHSRPHGSHTLPSSPMSHHRLQQLQTRREGHT